ncbi:hypothetical protein VTN00DRAFT_5469 [Thermoascus crustaceus]|uniref:uncharacterized protein n=1 Tax=Thermoascus crustaceus TaxID=5088 RepID=UPI00374440A6
MPLDPLLRRPGSCAMRLTDIDTLSSALKTDLLRSIATDISATFIYIAKQAEAGNLSTIHTAPINSIIRIIKDTEVAQRRALERKVRRYERQARRLREKRKMVKSGLGQVVKKAEEVLGGYRGRVEGLKGELRGVRRELELVREKYELLKERVERGKRGEEDKQDDGEGEQIRKDGDIGTIDGRGKH